MKKLHLFLCAMGVAYSIFAQGPAPRYVFLEHFTNSRCSICASRNPAFYNTIDDYPTQIHHISIHPSVPYANCVFYLANTQENNAWAAWYGIQGTPRVALNGTLVGVGNPLLPPATLQNALNQTSNLHLKVEESGSGANRTATIRAYTLGAIPAGNYRLFAAVAEKTINLLTPNNEPVHYDVFRDMLPDMSGQIFTPAMQGNFVEFSFNFTLNPNWNPDEIYVLAFIKNMDTGEVLNSGTKFDPVFTSIQEPGALRVSVWPNPASEQARIQLPLNEQAGQVEVFSLSGRRAAASFTQSSNMVELSLGSLSPGVYLVKVTGRSGVYHGKLVKQ